MQNHGTWLGHQICCQKFLSTTCPNSTKKFILYLLHKVGSADVSFIEKERNNICHLLDTYIFKRYVSILNPGNSFHSHSNIQSQVQNEGKEYTHLEGF